MLPPQPKRRTGRAYRRMMNERKYKHLFKIVAHGYRPHAGYVDWSYVDGKWMPTGKYIKYPKNSNCQNWCKKACAKGLTRDDMLRAKEAMLEMGIDIRDEDAVAGFAVSRKLLGLDRRKK